MVKRILFICTALILLDSAIYLQLAHAQPISLDDLPYIMHNPHVTGGLNLQSIRWAFTTTNSGTWHPLVWLSHMAVFQVFGSNPGAHHLANLLIHIVGTLSVFATFYLLTRQMFCSALLAAIFGVHPAHVESVAWIVERKDVMFLPFYMLGIAAYYHYAKQPSVLRYVCVVVAYILALMSKPMAMTLPGVLLLIDFWPLNRVANFKVNAPELRSPNPASWKRIILEKLPLVLVSLISLLFTFHSQKQVQSAHANWAPPEMRIANALLGFMRYIGLFVWPARLSIIYPFPRYPFPLPVVFASAGLLLLISALTLRRLKSQPYLAVGWFWFVGTLLPVIGFVQFGSQAIADRYTYLPHIGLSIALIWGMNDWIKNRPLLRKASVISAGAIVLLFTAMAWRQTQYWANSETLFARAIELHDDSWLAQEHLGIALKVRGDIDGAITHLSRAMEIKPTEWTIYSLIGDCFYPTNPAHAVPFYQTAAALAPPDQAEPFVAWGTSLLKSGQPAQALAVLTRAIQIDPANPVAIQQLAIARSQINSSPSPP